MAKNKKTANNRNTAPSINFAKWRNSLPATYETIIDGFHADMTVEQMVKYVGSNAKIPDKIKDIKIGCFTPNIFNHPDMIDFWQTPVNVPSSSLNRTLTDDADIVSTQRSTGYEIKRKNPDFETLTRLAQTQYLGFYSRIGALINNNLFNRLENLKQPNTYKKLRNSGFIKNNQLYHALPEKPPEFEVTRREFSIKDVESSLSKAYTRTGKPDDLEAFLSAPEQYGVFAVNDMLRTSLNVSRSQKNIDKKLYNNYVHVRNLLTIAAKEGVLGITAEEMSDQVCFPSSDRPSDQYPVFMFKGKFLHAGPNNSYLELPIEIQIPVLQEHVVKATHGMYLDSRNLKGNLQRLETEKLIQQTNFSSDKETELQALSLAVDALDKQRVDLINNNLPKDLCTIRYNYTKKGQVPAKDKLGIMIATQSELLKPNKITQIYALDTAKRECPDEYTAGSKTRIAPLTFGSMIQETNNALKMMIQESKSIIQPGESAQIQKAEKYTYN